MIWLQKNAKNIKRAYFIVTSSTVHKVSAATNTPWFQRERRACGKAHLNGENSIQKLRAAQFFFSLPHSPDCKAVSLKSSKKGAAGGEQDANFSPSWHFKSCLRSKVTKKRQQEMPENREKCAGSQRRGWREIEGDREWGRMKHTVGVLFCN